MLFTVHQPMIFPPIYLWARFASVEKVVLIGSDYAKQDGWHTRFQLEGRGGKITIPAHLSRRFGRPINEVEFDQPIRFFSRLNKTLKMYQKCTYYGCFEHLLRYDGERFGEYCSKTIRRIARYLDLSVSIIDIEDLCLLRSTNASVWLADIGQAVGGTRYLCASDAVDKYLDPTPFAEKKIEIVPQYYKLPILSHVTYPQTSILTLLAHYAPNQIRETLQS